MTDIPTGLLAEAVLSRLGPISKAHIMSTSFFIQRCFGGHDYFLGIVVQPQRALAALHAIFLATTADVQACFLYPFYMAVVNSRADHFSLGQFSEALALPMSNQYSSLQVRIEERVCVLESRCWFWSEWRLGDRSEARCMASVRV